jgi:hypothetical protein
MRMPEASTMHDQIRGMAMALRHWFDIVETDDLIVEAGLRASRSKGFFTRGTHDRRFEVLAINALPPQIIRLKQDSPITTLHLLQDVYDDGELRADPWRWWFAWISVEMIARLGPDATGTRVKEFIKKDESLGHIRTTVARWLASNPARMEIVEREFATLVDQTVASGEDGLSIENIVRHPVMTLVEAMAGEAGRISAAVTGRLAEKTK